MSTSLSENVSSLASSSLTALREALSQPARGYEPEGQSMHFESMDVYQTMEQEGTIKDAMTTLTSNPWYMRLWIFLVEEQSWLFLFVLGTFGGLVVLFLDFSMDFIITGRAQVVDLLYDPVARLVVWCVVGVALSLVAGLAVHYMSPHAAGSGIPEMKCVLSGMSLTHYLSFRTFFAKCVGLVCAISSGLSVGKEGPYVHISSILAHQLTRMPIFRRVARNDALRLQMIAAGCAVGVATTFGAPLGGVLFSIEVTSTYYLVHHLWKGFFCAVCASVVVRLLGSMGLVALFSTEFDVLPYTSFELLVFVALGVVFGLFAVFFIRLVQWFGSLKRRYRVLSPEFRYTQITLISLLTAVLSYYLVYLRSDHASIINDLFEDGDMKIISTNAPLHLLIFASVRMMLTALSVLLPIPCGLFGPVFLIGGALGRMVGELLSRFTHGVVRGGYAVVGAAAFSGSVTRSLSTAMILFELTGQLHHMLPVMLSVLVACAVANVWTDSIYDVLLRSKKLPYMPIYSPQVSDRLVSDILLPVPSVPQTLSYAHLRKVLNACASKNYYRLPVVSENHHLVGTIPWKVLRDFMHEREAEYDAHLEHVVLPRVGNALSTLVDGSPLMNELLAERVAFFEATFTIPSSLIDHSPLQMVSKTPLSKAHFIFSMLSPANVYVTENGVLIGVLSKERFIAVIAESSFD